MKWERRVGRGVGRLATGTCRFCSHDALFRRKSSVTELVLSINTELPLALMLTRASSWVTELIFTVSTKHAAALINTG